MDPPFSTHEFQVTQLFECQSTTPVFINSETTTSNVIRLAPEYPVIVSAAAAAQSGDITLDFNLTNLASDLRYNLYRDNTLIKTFLFSEYENFTIVTSGDYTDSGKLLLMRFILSPPIFIRKSLWHYATFYSKFLNAMTISTLDWGAESLSALKKPTLKLFAQI